MSVRVSWVQVLLAQSIWPKKMGNMPLSRYLKSMEIQAIKGFTATCLLRLKHYRKWQDIPTY